jgi:hypothetical protein
MHQVRWLALQSSRPRHGAHRHGLKLLKNLRGSSGLPWPQRSLTALQFAAAAAAASTRPHPRPSPRPGLLTFLQPKLPIDLNAGFPDRYTSKSDGEASPVGTIIEAAGAAGVDWQVQWRMAWPGARGYRDLRGDSTTARQPHRGCTAPRAGAPGALMCGGATKR